MRKWKFFVSRSMAKMALCVNNHVDTVGYVGLFPGIYFIYKR